MAVQEAHVAWVQADQVLAQLMYWRPVPGFEPSGRGDGPPHAAVRADAVSYMRALAGRDSDVPLHLVSGEDSAVGRVRQATVPF